MAGPGTSWPKQGPASYFPSIEKKYGRSIVRHHDVTSFRHHHQLDRIRSRRSVRIDGSNDCAANTTNVGCDVATVVISPSTGAGGRSADLFNHYSLLATAEEMLGLPKLGQAAVNASMVKAFNL